MRYGCGVDDVGDDMIEEELEGQVMCHVADRDEFIFLFHRDQLSFLDLETTTR